MKYFITFLIGLSSLNLNAQNSLNDQLDDFARSVPSFYHGYSQLLLEELAAPIVLGSQIQHWNSNWRLKYSAGISMQTFGLQSIDVRKIDRSELYEPSSIQYMGALNNSYGNRDATIIRQYLLAEDGNRVVHPRTGEYLSFETRMPGGLGGILAVVPFSMPTVELRVLHGLILSGGYLPLNYFLNDIETGNFKTKASSFSLGASLHLRSFFEIPVLSWLRFDASQSQTKIGLLNIQDAIDLGSNPIMDIELNSFNLQSDIITYQYKASMAIPASKNLILVLQAGYYGHNYHFKFDYDVEATVDSEKLTDEYQLDFKETDLSTRGSYVQSNDSGKNLYYAGGFLFDGQVANVYLGFAQINHPTITLKTCLKIF